MIDLHCHVLPGIDDGPETLEDSLALCHAAYAAGTRTIVATPHVSWEYPDNDAARIADGCAEVNAALDREGLGLRVLAGAEVAVTRGIELDDDELRALRLGDSPWLLAEVPFTAPASGFEPLLHRLMARGLKLVLAHPERTVAILRDREPLERLVASGVLTAITGAAVDGGFGKEVQRLAESLLRDGLGHVVTSDAHRASGLRSPALADGLVARDQAHAVEHFCWAAPGALLAGDDLPPAPAWQARRGLLARLRPS